MASAACRLPHKSPGAWRRAAKEAKGRIPEYRRSRMTDRQTPLARTDFRLFRAIATRWMDNDVYGHVNNVNYYSYFDTAIAHFLMGEGGLDPWRDPIVGFCVESGCRFRRSGWGARVR